MKNLRLIFGRWKDFYYEIEWPPTTPILAAKLDTFDIAGKQHEIARIYVSFIKANARNQDRIFFAFRCDDGFGEIEKLLQSLGDPFEEKVLTRSKGRSWSSRAFGSREITENVLLASTRSPEVIRRLFEIYDMEWYTGSQFWFLIADREPRDWMEQLANLSGPKEERILHSSTIEDSYCIMTTLWEHGIEILTDKIPRSQLEETVRNIAPEHNMTLTIEDREPIEA